MVFRANAQQLIRSIQNAHVHGLNPERYGQTEILTTLDTLAYLDTTRAVSNNPLATFDPRIDVLRDNLDQLLDTAFERLILHHGQGLVDARSTQYRLFRDVPKVQADTFIQAIANGQMSAEQALLSVQPGHGDLSKD